MNQKAIIFLAAVAALGGAYFLFGSNSGPSEEELAAQKAAAEKAAAEASSSAGVHATLIPQQRILLREVQLCGENPGFNYSSGCVNNTCETVVNFGANPIPGELTIQRSAMGDCVEQVLPNAAQYKIPPLYKTTFTLDAAVVQRLSLTPELALAKTPASRFAGGGVTWANHLPTIELNYTSVATTDELLVGTKLLKLTYDAAPAAVSVVPASPAEPAAGAAPDSAAAGMAVEPAAQAH